MQPNPTDQLTIRLSPGVIFHTDSDGRPGAQIQRGQSTTRFAIDRNIQTFLECFHEPLTLQQAAEMLEKQGFSRDNVLSFGKALLKTPLLEFHDDTLVIPAAADILKQAGMQLVTAFKDRKFDGVYQVIDQAGKASVVKLLRAPVALAPSARVLARMENEHAVLARLAGVAAVAGVGQFVAQPHPYFDIEYIDGATLTDQVMKPCTMAQRMQLACDALKAMAEVHRHGVIHGDLHTSNFMIDQQGRLRLIDFDCSFVAGSAYIPRVGGAVHFMPPERAPAQWHAGAGLPPDFASDIYQLGVILYFTLRGLPPYRGKQFAELAGAIASGDYPPLCQSVEEEPIAPGVGAAVHACMSYLPSGRPASLDEIVPVFESALRAEACR